MDWTHFPIACIPMAIEKWPLCWWWCRTIITMAWESGMPNIIYPLNKGAIVCQKNAIYEWKLWSRKNSFLFHSLTEVVLYLIRFVNKDLAKKIGNELRKCHRKSDGDHHPNTQMECLLFALHIKRLNFRHTRIFLGTGPKQVCVKESWPHHSSSDWPVNQQPIPFIPNWIVLIK